ncbi:membrane-associated guanylate kinase, WW and PDZ domain-containing protein 1 isoform X1 [Copidosoma floridanum]|uniref:membrane-associated guanylate kinase, WW and PDZ domain-containing protein 1 isoform X1 n=1 Tax=Copidosoma floridanum TaxID=29053 RepID=UPI000C6FBD11|nr:membrane-associated guanylate kinase, WW and PDZ domain-containing protein 1 isoform X1 [Copidosoma floridanum]
MSKELGIGAEDSDASSGAQHHHNLHQQSSKQRVPPTYVYSPSSDPESSSRSNGEGGPNDDGEPRHHRLGYRGAGVPPTEDQLGPLPHNWEKAYTDHGEVYFIDHNTGTSHWLDPRLSKFQKRSLEECCDDELPYGWEKIDDNLYGTYFIDHVNRRTQYENPVIQAKRALQQQQNNLAHHQQQNAMGEGKSPMFTRNPDALKGQRIRTSLVKSSRGLGFTIVGGDDNVQEFLQIKSVVPNGPAWLDGKLHTGDVLVYVNDICVLGFSHNEMVNVFKSIGSGETVALEVCRGYPLPFDPNDPNTEVVTTIAVNAPDILTEESSLYMDLERSAMRASERFDFLDSTSFMPVHPAQQNGDNLTTTASVNSMPDLCISEKLNSMGPIKRPSSTDILLMDSVGDRSHPLGHDDASSPVPAKPPEFLSIPIVKGITGFGFTIADSAHGQKVKKILDRDRCKNLMEGDILININDVNVRNMCHAEVVQVLKDCCRDQEALIHVQRSASKSPKSPLQDKDCLKDFKDKAVFDFYRSKTPTADIYSTQQKAIVPQRPKTPLIDTRNSKTMSPLPPSASLQQQQHHEQLRQTSVDCVDNEVQNALDNRYKYNQDYGHPIYGYTTEMPYKPNVSHLVDSFNAMNLSGMEMEDSLARKWLANNDKLNYSNDVYSIDVAQQQQLNHHHHQPPPPPPPPPLPSQHAKQNGIHGPPMAANDYYKDIYALQSPTQSQFDGEHADYGSYVAMIGQEQNVDTGEIWDKRKESTSFEHEQPHSSSIMPRYVPYGSDVGNDLMCPSIPDIEWIETLVTLVRQDSGFGFRIVGGTEEGSQVSVGHIVPGGAADLDGRLNTGDFIMSVDGESVMNSSHHRVVQLMISAAQNGRVTLGIRRRISLHDHHHHYLQQQQQRQQQQQQQQQQMQDQMQSSSSLSYNCRLMGHVQYPYEVTVTRMENEGFGFVIISSVNKAGSTIGRIIEGSPAERCARLNVGDHILAVNHVDITNACHKDIVNLIKDSGYSVTLTIGYPLDDCCSNASLSQKDEMIGDGDGGQYHAVELTRGTRGFGFSIRGGREFQNMPLFVLQIAENGPASIDNRLRVGDQIIEINSINTKNMTHTEAIEIIRNGGPTVRLLVRRGCQMPSVSNAELEQANLNMTAEGTRPGIIIQTLERPLKKNRLSLSLDCCCSSQSRQM